MLQVSRDIQVAFDRKIEEALVRREERPTYRKWLRFYLDFCSKYRHPPDFKGSLPRFLSKLASKNQSAERQAQAARYYPNGSERDLELFNRDQSRILTWSHDETARLSIISQGKSISPDEHILDFQVRTAANLHDLPELRCSPLTGG